MNFDDEEVASPTQRKLLDPQKDYQDEREQSIACTGKPEGRQGSLKLWLSCFLTSCTSYGSKNQTLTPQTPAGSVVANMFIAKVTFTDIVRHVLVQVRDKERDMIAALVKQGVSDARDDISRRLNKDKAASSSVQVAQALALIHRSEPTRPP